MRALFFLLLFFQGAGAFAAKTDDHLPGIRGQDGWHFEVYKPRGGRRLIAVTSEDPEPGNFVVAVSHASPRPVYLSRQLYDELSSGKRNLESIRDHISIYEKANPGGDGTTFVNIDGGIPSSAPPAKPKTDTNLWNLKGGIRNDGLHGDKGSGGVSFSTIIVQPATPAPFDLNTRFSLPGDRPYFRAFRIESAFLRKVRGGVDEKSLGTYLARLKEHGIETLILAYAETDGSPLEHKLTDGKDFLEVFFRLAGSLSLEVYLGLTAPGKPSGAQALHARFGKSPAFRGWYLGPRSYCLDRDLARWALLAKKLRILGGHVLLKSSLHATACDGKHEGLAAKLKAGEGAYTAVIYEDGLEAGAVSAMKDGRLASEERFGNLSCGKEICREKALAELAGHYDRVAATHAKTRVGWWLEVQALSRSGPCSEERAECPEQGMAQMWNVVLKQLEAAVNRVSQRSNVVLSGAQAVLSFGAEAGELEHPGTKAAANRFTESYRRYLARTASAPEVEEKREPRKPGVAYCNISGSAFLKNGKTKLIPKEHHEVGGDKDMSGPEKAGGVCAKAAQDIAAVVCVQDDAKQVALGILIEVLLPDGSTRKQEGKYERDCDP